MKLSIIIALYNTEKYIEKCIRSVYVANTMSIEEFEVLVINDGSKDNSETIVKRLQNEFANLQLITKENGGQSTARNIGFKKARGKFLFCLDSDDSLNAKVLINALEYAIHTELDMLPIFFQRFDENGIKLNEKRDNYPLLHIPITGPEFLCKYVISGSMWRYLYKTSIVHENNLYLTEGIYHEDEEFIVKFLSYSTRIAYQRHYVYNHIVRGDSTVNKKERKHRIKLLNDLLVVVENLSIHRTLFLKDSFEYRGISKKLEQLIITIFLRLKNEGFEYKDVQFFIDRLISLGLYPI